MSDKTMLCNGCGQWKPDGSLVDTGDGAGSMWTCTDCEDAILAELPVRNTRKLLQYAIDKGVAIDPQLALDTLDGKVTETDLGLPILYSALDEENQ